MVSWLGTKSDLIGILAKDSWNEPPDNIDAKILDGGAVVHFPPTTNI
jgi:hypothetical protein